MLEVFFAASLWGGNKLAAAAE